MKPEFSFSLTEKVRERKPVIHCITNYVTARDVANVILACGGSPIMADHPEEAEEVTALSSSLLLNLGTLKDQGETAMIRAGRKAVNLGIPVIFDPVGAGSSTHRTEAAKAILKEVRPSILRGNASELKALLKLPVSSRGVDAGLSDRITENSKEAYLNMAKYLCELFGCVTVITGTIDLVASRTKSCLIRNGCMEMSRITGSGCMLDGLIAAYAGAAWPQPFLSKEALFQAAVLATALSGVCGERAAANMKSRHEGLGSFHRYFLDEISLSDSRLLKGGANLELQS